ncbi:MAG: serine hydrolase domain-containing protein, partial [Bacteroidota bacterium]
MLRRLCLLLLCVLAALSVRAQPAPDGFPDRADALLTAYHRAGLLNGAVLVAEGDRVLYEGGFGFADHAWEIPNTPDTRFRVASTTKQFTSALV